MAYSSAERTLATGAWTRIYLIDRARGLRDPLFGEAIAVNREVAAALGTSRNGRLKEDLLVLIAALAEVG